MSSNTASRESDQLRSLLKKAREEAGLTQRELSRRLERKYTYIQKLESGELRRIDIFEILAILRVVRKDAKEFFDEFLSAVSKRR